MYDPKKNFEFDEIDNLYDELFPEAASSVGLDEIENLYDELVTHGTGSDPVAQGGVVLEFLDGSTRNGFSVELQQSSPNEISLQCEDGSQEEVLSLTDISCIRASTLPADFVEPDQPCYSEVIETAGSTTYHADVPDAQDHPELLLAFPSEGRDLYRYLLFPLVNIKLRYLNRYLGEIFIDKQMISKEELGSALEHLQKLKNAKIGQIIAQKAQIQPRLVEEQIKKASQANSGTIRVGEILVAAGLVDEELVNQALAIQRKLKEQKIGEFLIQKKLLQEEEVFQGLAEKFRIPLVDLRKVVLSPKLIARIPRELVLKHQVLPYSFIDSILHAVTTVPDNPSLREVVFQYTKQKSVRLALVRPSQFYGVVKQLFQKS
ncbi:hypothetical protein ACFL6N_02655 [Thermodesulfobacteriota bacterium]